MAADPLPPLIREFLRAHIQSVAQMDILSIMCRDPGRSWTARAIDAILCHNEAVVKRRLLEFSRAGVIMQTADSPPAYRCQGSDSPLGAALRETIEAYHTRPVKVIETIFKPEGDAAQQFADAFRIRPTDHA